MTEEKKHYEVVAAVLVQTAPHSPDLIFAAQRPGPKPDRTPIETNYKWEFPGGKIEAGETRESALKREIREEFSANIIVGDFITTVNHEYKSFSITMRAFYCTLATPDEKLELKEHLDSKWLPREKLLSLDWAAADLPIVKAIV